MDNYYSGIRVSNLHCSNDCMIANKCCGHSQCENCGAIVCGCELDDDGLCQECHDEKDCED